MADEPSTTEATTTTEVPADQVSSDSSSTETTEPKQQTVDPNATTETSEGAPETYAFTNPEGVPEDVKIAPAIHDAYSEVARELNLPQDKAQGLFTKTMSALHEFATGEQERQTKEWTKTAKADKEYGGKNLDENLGIAQKAVEQFGSDGLKALLEEPNGIGNHPEVIRWMFNVGKAISEDRFVGSNTGNSVNPTDEAARAAKLYPSSVKK